MTRPPSHGLLESGSPGRKEMPTAWSPALHSNDSGSVRGVVLGVGMTPGLGFYWESLAPWGEGCKGSHCPPLCPGSAPFQPPRQRPTLSACGRASLPQGLLAAGVTTAHTGLCTTPQPGHPAVGHCRPERADICPAHSPTKILAGSGIPQLGVGGGSKESPPGCTQSSQVSAWSQSPGSSGLGALQGPRSGLPQVMGRGLGWS